MTSNKVDMLRTKIADALAVDQPPDDPDYTVKDVMAAVGVSQAAVCQAALDGRLVGYRVRAGRGKANWRFKEEDVIAWAVARRRPGQRG